MGNNTFIGSGAVIIQNIKIENLTKLFSINGIYYNWFSLWINWSKTVFCE